jgi:hypothetical protein
MCNKYWSTQRVFEHLGQVLHEQVLNPDDGSIELEKDRAIEILRWRGVLV